MSDLLRYLKERELDLHAKNDRLQDYIRVLSDEVARLHTECLEWARLSGAGEERELALRARVAELERYNLSLAEESHHYLVALKEIVDCPREGFLAVTAADKMANIAREARERLK